LVQLFFDADLPYASLDAADEKNRQGNDIPLRADLAADLRQWLADKLVVRAFLHATEIELDARRVLLVAAIVPIAIARRRQREEVTRIGLRLVPKRLGPRPPARIAYANLIAVESVPHARPFLSMPH